MRRLDRDAGRAAGGPGRRGGRRAGGRDAEARSHGPRARARRRRRRRSVKVWPRPPGLRRPPARAERGRRDLGPCAGGVGRVAAEVAAGRPEPPPASADPRFARAGVAGRPGGLAVRAAGGLARRVSPAMRRARRPRRGRVAASPAPAERPSFGDGRAEEASRRRSRPPVLGVVPLRHRVGHVGIVGQVDRRAPPAWRRRARRRPRRRGARAAAISVSAMLADLLAVVADQAVGGDVGLAEDLRRGRGACSGRRGSPGSGRPSAHSRRRGS